MFSLILPHFLGTEYVSVGVVFLIAWVLRTLWVRETKQQSALLIGWMWNLPICFLWALISSWPKGTGGAGTMEKLQGSKGAQFSPAACLSQKVFLLSNPICAEWQQVKWEGEKESQCLKMSFSAVSHTLGEVTGRREVHVGHVYFLLGILLPEPKGEWESLSELSLLADCGRTGHALLLLAYSSSWLFWRSLPF